MKRRDEISEDVFLLSAIPSALRPALAPPLGMRPMFFVPMMREASQEIKDWKTVRLPASNLTNCPHVCSISLCSMRPMYVQSAA